MNALQIERPSRIQATYGSCLTNPWLLAHSSDLTNPPPMPCHVSMAPHLAHIDGQICESMLYGTGTSHHAPLLCVSTTCFQRQISPVGKTMLVPVRMRGAENQLRHPEKQDLIEYSNVFGTWRLMALHVDTYSTFQACNEIFWGPDDRK